MLWKLQQLCHRPVQTIWNCVCTCEYSRHTAARRHCLWSHNTVLKSVNLCNESARSSGIAISWLLHMRCKCIKSKLRKFVIFGNFVCSCHRAMAEYYCAMFWTEIFWYTIWLFWGFEYGFKINLSQFINWKAWIYNKKVIDWKWRNMPALGLWAEADLASSVCCTAQRPRAGIFRHIQSITYKYGPAAVLNLIYLSTANGAKYARHEHFKRLYDCAHEKRAFMALTS